VLTAASLESDCALNAESALPILRSVDFTRILWESNSAYIVVVFGHGLKRTSAKPVLVCTVTDSMLIRLVVFERR